MSAQGASIFFPVGGIGAEWSGERPRVGPLQGQTDNDGVAECPHIVELSMHVAKRGTVLSHGIVQLGSLIGDTYQNCQ